LLGGVGILQLLEVNFQEKFTFFYHLIWVSFEQDINFLQQRLMAFLVLYGSKAVVVEGYVPVDPLGVSDVKKVQNECLDPGLD
jgi:hypothetical protein